MTKKYEIEHIGITVGKPVEMAKWYHEVLGFNIKFSSEGGAFLTDASDKVMIEFTKVKDAAPLAERINHHLQLHIAVKSEDPDKDAKELEAAGATFIAKCAVKRPEDKILVLRDPWGNTIQLVKRKEL